MHKLLVTNMDGTLMDHDGKLNKWTKAALQYIDKKGITFVLATSNSFFMAQKLMKQLNIDGYIVSHQGAYIATTENRPIYVKRLSEKLTYEVVELLEEYSCEIKVLHEKNSIKNKIKNGKDERKFTFSPYKLLQLEKEVEQITEVLKKESIASTKINVTFQTLDELEEVKLLLNQLYDQIDYVETTPFTLEIVSKGVSKQFGLTYICDQLQIKADEIVAIGSSRADIDIVQFSGLGVAMQNSPEELKDVADWITRSVENNGVAYMVMEHFRKQHQVQI